MRRIIVLLVVCWFALPLVARAGEERIVDFSAQLTVQPDRTIHVEERIAYDLGTSPKHGIYRELPYEYTQHGSRYTVRYSLQSVVDERGETLPTQLTRSGGKLRIRIGDPEVTTTGEHVYVITYTVERALPQFEGKDEIYWNVTGNGWDVPIATASAILTLPEGARATQIACYTGASGSTAQDCEYTGETVVTFLAQDLAAHEGLTIAVQLPEGTVSAETSKDRVGYFVQDNWIVVLPILVFFILHWQWRKRGRDPKGRGTIIPQYESPRGMTPAVVGTAQDNLAGAQEFSATLIHLASRGYLKIADLGKANLLGTSREYQFTKGKSAGPELQTYEQTLLTGLFANGGSVTTKTLKYKFAKTYQQFVAEVRKQLVDGGMYKRDPHVTQVATIAAGLACIAACGFIANLLQPPLLVVQWLSLVASAGVVVVYGLLMPARTPLGAEILEEVRGFQWFLSVTEAERLKFHNAPAKKPEQFMEFLPYAVALGVEKEWAQQFKDLAIPQPGWYDGNLGMFNALVFANAMSSMSTDVKSSLAAVPGGSGSGGGGFSGGGFGGGGGGSW